LGAGITQTQQESAKPQVLGLTSAAAIWTTAWEWRLAVVYGKSADWHAASMLILTVRG